MDEILRRLNELARPNPETARALADIALVALLIFFLLRLIRGTRAWRIVGGIVLFVVALFGSDYLGLRTLHWILDRATALAPVALVILLLPELRRALESLAQLGFWPTRLSADVGPTSAGLIDHLVSSATALAAQRMGAIFVVERNISLADVAANGVGLDAAASPALLTSIFFKNNPLHDGAVILRGSKVVAAACQLPLAEADPRNRTIHMRHRAALGITEQSDALAIVVSEERGTISVAQNGALRIVDGPNALRDTLNEVLRDLSRTPRRGRVRKEKSGVP